MSNPGHHLIEVDRLEIQGIREAVYLPSYGFLFLFIFFFLSHNSSFISFL